LQRHFEQVSATVSEHVKRIEKERLGSGAMVLEEVERDPPVPIYCNDLSIDKCPRGQSFTRARDIRELLGEEIASS
jgi:hypothetical protein